jgi:hypothetical protein
MPLLVSVGLYKAAAWVGLGGVGWRFTLPLVTCTGGLLSLLLLGALGVRYMWYLGVGETRSHTAPRGAAALQSPALCRRARQALFERCAFSGVRPGVGPLHMLYTARRAVHTDSELGVGAGLDQDKEVALVPAADAQLIIQVSDIQLAWVLGVRGGAGWGRARWCGARWCGAGLIRGGAAGWGRVQWVEGG